MKTGIWPLRHIKNINNIIRSRAGWNTIRKEILAQIKEAAEEVMEKAHVTAEQVECMGIDNQGETVVVWDKVTGEPLYPAIVWQDRRTATWIEELEEDIQYMIRQKTGLHADAYFGATKIKWILDNVEGAKEAAMEGRLLAGPTDSWFYLESH